MKRTTSTAIALTLAMQSCVSPIPAGLSAHPQGLLPSQDTVTTPSGFLEIEATGSWGTQEEQAVALTRYGLADRTELYLAQDLRHSLSRPGEPTAEGLGDAWVGIRHRVIDRDSEGVAHALLAEVRIPHSDVDPGFNASGLELHLAHIRDGSWGSSGWTTNADLFFLSDPSGRPDPALGGSFTWTSDLIEVMGKRLPVGLLAEAGGLFHPEQDQAPAWLAAGLRVPLHPSLELQLAWVQGIGSDGPEDRLAINLGRLVGDALFFGARPAGDS